MPSPEERKLLILKAAIWLFARQGYDATTLAQIAREAGASIGSVVHFFQDKPHLLLDARESALADLTATVEGALRRHHRDVAKAAAEVIRAYFDWVSSNPEMAILVHDVAVSRTGQSGSLTAAARLHPVFEAWMADFREAGLNPGYDARYLVALILGPAMTFAAAQGEQQQDDPGHASLVADLARAAAAALGAGGRNDQKLRRQNRRHQPESEFNLSPQRAEQADFFLIAPLNQS